MAARTGPAADRRAGFSQPDRRTTGMARLLDQYNQTIAPALATKFGVTNKMAIPKLEKIVVNMGVGRATQDKALLEAAVDSLGKITGQKPQVTKAKVSVSGFRLREGNEIGCKVTLRGKRMYEFLDRLVSIALPRIRDFRGVNPNSFDGHGNYTLGLAEQVVFPEIDADRIQHSQGMDITIVSTTSSDDQARELLRALGMPFRAATSKAS
jgi:large subunit ribosomal protein L5